MVYIFFTPGFCILKNPVDLSFSFVVWIIDKKRTSVTIKHDS